MDDTIKQMMNTNRRILEQRLQHGKRYDMADKIPIDDFKQNNLEQIGCETHNPNSEISCKMVVMMYEKSFNNMLHKFCDENGYTPNYKMNKIVKK